MTLTSGRYIGHEYDRMIVLFSMQDGGKEIPCAISTTAMDYLERGPQVRPEQREAQFVRLRDRIEARAQPASIERRNLKAIHGVSCCGASISDVELTSHNWLGLRSSFSGVRLTASKSEPVSD
jgi:hypothetical protein